MKRNSFNLLSSVLFKKSYSLKFLHNYSTHLGDEVKYFQRQGCTRYKPEKVISMGEDIRYFLSTGKLCELEECLSKIDNPNELLSFITDRENDEHCMSWIKTNAYSTEDLIELLRLLRRNEIDIFDVDKSGKNFLHRYLEDSFDSSTTSSDEIIKFVTNLIVDFGFDIETAYAEENALLHIMVTHLDRLDAEELEFRQSLEQKKYSNRFKFEMLQSIKVSRDSIESCILALMKLDAIPLGMANVSLMDSTATYGRAYRHEGTFDKIQRIYDKEMEPLRKESQERRNSFR